MKAIFENEEYEIISINENVAVIRRPGDLRCVATRDIKQVDQEEPAEEPAEELVEEPEEETEQADELEEEKPKAKTRARR